MPSWSPDGEYIYYIETKRSRGLWPVNGRPGAYDMEVPHLMRVRVDRSAPPEDLESGRFRDGDLTWFSWMRQPVVSPSGKTVAMVTDQPRPDERDVVVQFYNLENGKFSRPDLPVTSPLGHQDPTWRPDGRFLAFVRNDREGATRCTGDLPLRRQGEGVPPADVGRLPRARRTRPTGSTLRPRGRARSAPTS